MSIARARLEQEMPLGRHAGAVAHSLKFLSNPDRLRMLCRIALGDRDGMSHPTVSDLMALTGLSQSSVSQQLAMLRVGGVVTPRRDGQSIRYTLVDARLRAIMAVLCDLCESGLPPTGVPIPYPN
jgi:DNA-binding transcriptional ArsR family regulator